MLLGGEPNDNLTEIELKFLIEKNGLPNSKNEDVKKLSQRKDLSTREKKEQL